MTGREIVAMCDKIIKRQDLDKSLLLMFINQQRRTILMDNYLYKLDKWIKYQEPENGFVKTTNLKQVRYLEYQLNGHHKPLERINTYQELLEMYDDVDMVGEPNYYLIMSGGIKIVPMPPEGVINIFGEFYPADLKEDNTEDILAEELSDVIIYFGCAEYFDMLNEQEQGAFWRAKGNAMFDKYIASVKRQMTDDKELMARDPFGNIGLVHGERRTGGGQIIIKNLDGGIVDASEGDI